LQAERREDEVSSLLKACRAVLENRELEEAAQVIFETCKKLVGASSGYVELSSKDGAHNEILLLDSGGMPCAANPALPMPIRGLREEACRKGRPVYHNDFTSSDSCKLLPEGHMRLDNVMFSPLTIKGEVLGLIGLGNKSGGFTEDDARIASAFGELASIALLNSKTLSALQNSEEQLRFLSSRLLQAHEEERKRLSRGLHDSIGGTLSAVKFSLENARGRIEEGEVTPEPFDELIDMVRGAIEESRRIYMDLRPSILDDLGVVPTIGWFCKRFQSIYSDIGVESEITVDEEEIPEEIKIVIFRIMQEALNNCAKYSKADLVRVTLSKRDDRVELCVEDNGKGFSMSAIPGKPSDKGGLGLTSMRERAELSGGSFKIGSAIGEGTTVRASWPPR
jgi:signal transduction histidine kinase